MQTQIGLSNMQQANAMALQNANRLFEAMRENTANQQQANMGTFQAQNQQATNKANDQAGFLASEGNLWQNQSNQRAMTNNQNQINQQQQQFASDKDMQTRM